MTQAQPAHLARRNTVLPSITQYPYYHGPISGDEAKERLKLQLRNSFLVRFSETQNKYILSVLKRGDNKTVIFRNFVINTETKLDQHEYEIEGSQKKFDNFSELLNYYKRYQISTEINCIGSPLFDLNAPPSPKNNLPKLMIDAQPSGLLPIPKTNPPKSPSFSATTSKMVC